VACGSWAERTDGPFYKPRATSHKLLQQFLPLPLLEQSHYLAYLSSLSTPDRDCQSRLPG